VHRRARKRLGRWEVTDQNPPGTQQRSCSDAYTATHYCSSDSDDPISIARMRISDKNRDHKTLASGSLLRHLHRW
jgi:hypothetical protein